MSRFFNFLRRRPRPPGFAVLGEERRDVALTLEEVTEWATSLNTMLGTDEGRAEFRRFLRTEGVHRNLDFWEEIEVFKTITDREQMKLFAVHLYRYFLEEDNTDVPQIGEDVKQRIRDRMQNPTVDLFNEAEQFIWIKMLASYHRYLGSQYQEVLRTYQ